MNSVSLSRVNELLSYNNDTGVFTWRVSRGPASAGSVAGSLDGKGYLEIGIDGERYRAHRLAWLCVHGEWPEDQIDHINGSRDDNRIENLRQSSCAENMQNLRHAYKSNLSSGLLGVARSGNRWRAHIRVGGKKVHIGCFATKEAAHSAYLDAKSKLHEFSTLT